MERSKKEMLFGFLFTMAASVLSMLALWLFIKANNFTLTMPIVVCYAIAGALIPIANSVWHHGNALWDEYVSQVHIGRLQDMIFTIEKYSKECETLVSEVNEAKRTLEHLSRRIPSRF